MQTNTRKLISTLLVFALALSLFAVMPATASASFVSTLSPAQRLAMQINLFDHGGDAGSTLSASASGDNVTVTGTVTGATNTLELSIPASVTVIWKANYSGSVSGGRLIKLTGGGSFEVAAGASVIRDGDNYGSYVIDIMDANVTVTIRGIVGTTESGGGVIIGYNGNNTVNVMSGGVVSTEGDESSAIVNCARVNITGGTVSSNGGVAIGVFGNTAVVNISGGMVRSVYGAIAAVEGAKVNVTGGSVSSLDYYAINVFSREVRSGSVYMNGGVVSTLSDYPAITYEEGDTTSAIVGGFIFGCGTIIIGTPIYESPEPIRDATDGSSIASGTAMLCSWNKPASGTPTYTDGSSTDLSANTGASVKWGKQSGDAGIFYSNGGNSGFFPISGVTVNPAAPTAPPPSTGGSMDNFNPPVNNYTSGKFTDVDENAWYGFNQQGVIANAYNYGLMTGTSATTFHPTGNMSVAEAITVAARVHSIYKTGAAVFAASSPWYQVYVDYAIDKGIIKATDFTNYTRAVTRAEMAYIFSRSLPATEFPSRNTVNSLPDVNNSTLYKDEIFMLYKAGVVQGSGAAGTFYPANNIIRAEAAAIISRVILPGTRLSGRTFGA